MNNNSKGAIILGGHIQALGIVRSLGKRKIPVYLVQSEVISIAMFSKYVKKTFISPSEFDDINFINYLISLSFKNKFNNFILFPTNDQQVSLISKNYDILSKSFILAVPKWGISKKIINKKNTFEIAKSLGMDQPKTYFPGDLENVKTICKKMEFPCIIKPAVMHKFFRKTKKKVVLCKNKNELLRNYLISLKYIKKDEVMIQEVIPGDGSHLYSFCSFHKDGNSFLPLVCIRKRQHPIDFGNGTTFAISKHDVNLQKVSSRLLEKINFSGLSEVEFKKDPRDNKFKFLEVNSRTWKWHSISNTCTHDYSFIQFSDLYGDSLSVSNEQPKEKLSWIHLTTDIFVLVQMLFRKFISFEGYKRSIVGRLHFANLSKTDPLPFFVELFL